MIKMPVKILMELDNLLASKRSLAFDWKMPMEPRADRSEMPMELHIDRPRLPMERRQLKINKGHYEMKRWVHRY